MAASDASPRGPPAEKGADAEAYAAGLRTRVMLRDGTVACIRAIRADDKERVRDAFERLSPQTVYRRFFNHLKALTSGALRKTTEVDFRDDVALALTIGEEPGERLIALAQFVRVAPGADSAEVAFVVADDYQHRGAATLLLRHLVPVARGLGIRELVADVLDDNRDMLEVFENSGLPLRQTLERDVRRIALCVETKA